jgi:hypothetical protein
MKADRLEVVKLGTRSEDAFHAAARGLYESLGFIKLPIARLHQETVTRAGDLLHRPARVVAVCRLLPPHGSPPATRSCRTPAGHTTPATDTPAQLRLPAAFTELALAV